MKARIAQHHSTVLQNPGLFSLLQSYAPSDDDEDEADEADEADEEDEASDEDVLEERTGPSATG